jgi:S-adenosylmethionine:tRNA ribosyltransferase-isomerase
MVLDRATGRIVHRIFRDLPQYLRSGDCLVLNTTKVLPARFEARRATGGRIKGLFLNENEPGVWHVLIQGVGKLQAGETLELVERTDSEPPHPNPPHTKGREWQLTLLTRLERGEAQVRVEPADPAAVVLDRIGRMPLPPYIHRAAGRAERTTSRAPRATSRAREQAEDLDAADRADYQTVYASAPGAVAAPTAGLHFTPGLVAAIRRQGVAIAEVVLHVGLGTFHPIEADDLADHNMHKEWYSLPAQAVDTIQSTRATDGRLIAVGTTSVRVLETCAGAGSLTPQQGWTDIFIYPPYEFHAVDGLITNFHLPRSTLLALVCAFAGRERVLLAYECAIAERYRFYSYGDAMLII